MPLQIEHLAGHKVTVDATTDPEHVFVVCSCGGLDWQGGPVSGQEMIAAYEVLNGHLSEHGAEHRPDSDRIAASYARLFDMMFPDPG